MTATTKPSTASGARGKAPPLEAVKPTTPLTAFRIVQEAFTNVLKHSDASLVTVTVRRSTHTIELEVADDGTGPMHATVDGHGLAGMRERVCAYGGDLVAGPRPHGGFHVSARLEVPRSP